jgi:site-specific DNA recombinase
MAGHGRVVAEYFDVGQSQVLPWARRPEAAALVAAMADPDRCFDAIVVGEYERAFYGNQFTLMAPLFDHYGVQPWMPEAGGAVDFVGEAHEQLMIGLGIQSKREITRARSATRIGRSRRGLSAPYGSSWPIRDTPAGRYGTGNPPPLT